MAELKAGLRTS